MTWMNINKLMCLCFLWFVLSIGARAQSKHRVTDTIQLMLCKSWNFRFVVIGGAHINQDSVAKKFIYKFKTNKTFIILDDNHKNKTTGKWSYDAKTKLIKLTDGNTIIGSVASLKESELVIDMATNQFFPMDLKSLQLVFYIESK